MRQPATSAPGNRLFSFRKKISIVFFVCLFILLSIHSTAAAANPAGLSLEVPSSANIGEIIKVKVKTTGGSEGVWFSTTGLRQIRGYFDHCGWCSTPCLVGDEIQTCSDCCGPYCLSCTWSSGHEFSDTWFGGPTIEYEVTGCGTATITPTYYGRLT
ncbi:hypothetical protein [Desulfobacula sp.]|uniref:hypothetical protein n=1 Tax=Desulfobacula sp. TaxID=2593537 RepID=UPI0026190836|nr:hypothetical protein [Desulfobacula sp.]